MKEIFVATTFKEYIEEKIQILNDFGINNVIALKLLFRKETANIHDDTKKELKIERLCHDIIKNYLVNGDRTYCTKSKLAEHYYAIIKANFEKEDALDEATILRAVGKDGLVELKRCHFIEAYGDSKLYAI